VMEEAGIVKAGWQTSTYYTNRFISQ
jgi:hypothetical protein